MGSSSPRALTARDLLVERKDDLIQRWTRRVLDDPAVPEASRLSEPDLLDHIPELIDRVVASIEAPDTRQAATLDCEGREHARHRLARDYRLTETLSELSHLRAAILDLCAEEGVSLEIDTARRLHAAIDDIMISESNEIERAALESFREQVAFRERFIGVLGHDLRTPLQAIQVLVALLEHDETRESQARLIQRILASADRMARMIGDLLEATRARFSGGVPIEPTQVDLGAVAREAIDEIGIVRPSRTIELDTQGDARGTWDPDRMAQAISNLVSNAFDFSQPDTPVRVSVRGEPAHVLLVVNNRGPTIAPDVIAHIFEPFVRGSQGGRATSGQGLGLGLFIVHQIVVAHGGTIDVTSTPADGTTFTVRLPRSK